MWNHTRIGDENPETAELRRSQHERETTEQELAEHADLPDERRTHSRRAERAEYLRRKLEERARSERERG